MMNACIGSGAAGLRNARRVVGGRVVAAAAVFLSLAPFGVRAQTDPPPTPSNEPGPASANKSLDTVNVERERTREGAKEAIHNYVSAVVPHTFDRSLAIWQSPVCPLVAGLARDRAEYVIARLSQSVVAAHAPLAGPHCAANFFVVLTNQPDELLKKWQARDRGMFNDHDGLGGIKRFVNTPRPIRIWYNTGVISDDGQPLTSDSLPASSFGLSPGGYNQYPQNRVQIGSHVELSAVRHLASVIIVVDTTRTGGVNIGQFADYVALIGLTELRLDANLGTTPTILRLFDPSADPRPQSLTEWDKAFLQSLYTTSLKSVMQVSQMETRMLETIDPK